MSDELRDDGGTDDAPPFVSDAARKIASGDPVDWPSLESSAPNAASREVLERLHEVEAIAAFHREWQSGAPMPPVAPPATWGSLTIVDEIGHGSFGRVYRARDPRLDREVALKLLDHGPIADSPQAQAVIEEGRHLARLRHPNIVSIYGADRVDGRVGLEMELIAGRTLSEIVQTQGPFGPDEAALVCRDVCRALAAVHRAGLVHRDVKAQNVIREHGGRAVLMDFGAGRLADVIASAGIAGTPLYLAPEVLAGSAPTTRSDLYSVGVLLYYLVTGSFPVEARTIDELREAHRSATVRRLRDARPDLPDRFIELVERALAPDPANRISSAGTFEAELSRFLGHVDRAASSTPVYWPLAAAIAIALALAIGTSVWALWPPGSASPDGTAAAVRSDQSIAVLPFVSRSGVPGDEYLGDGMADGLIAALGKVPGLRVAARTSAFSFKGQVGEAREVARRLGVGALLEGTISKSGTHVRATTSLIGAEDGLPRWSEAFDSEAGDVFALQDEITRAVAEQLSLTLGGAALRASQAGGTKDLAAQDLYLRGRAAANQLTEMDLHRALDFYQRALARDSEFARAYAGIAMVNVFLADAYEPAHRAYSAARAAAIAAIARDDFVADAHAVLGYAGFAVDWNRATAERAYRRALEIDPNSVSAQTFFGTHLCGFGRFDEGWAHLLRGAQLDPLSPGAAWAVEFCAFMTMRHRDVIEAHKRTEAITPGFVYVESLVADAYRELGDFPAALREYETAGRAVNGAPQYGLGLLYVRMGRDQEAREIMRRLDDLATRQYVPFVDRAVLHGALGNLDQGVALLQRAFDNREMLLVALRGKLRQSALFKDPRARQIMERAETIWQSGR